MSKNSIENTSTIWFCHDCYYEFENSSLADRYPDITSGMMPEAHRVDCDLRNSYIANESAEILGIAGDSTEIYDCSLDCGTREFGDSACDNCGSTIGGTRHAMTYHFTAIVYRSNSAGR